MGGFGDEYRRQMRDQEAHRAAMSPEERRRSDVKVGLGSLLVVAILTALAAAGGALNSVSER